MIFRHALLVTALLAFPGAAFAQDLKIPDVIYPKLVAQAATPAGFVPAGWTLEGQERGDLNKDGLPDFVLILKDADAKNIVDAGPDWGKVDTNPHILAVIVAKAGGGYALALENHTLVPRKTAPDDQASFDAKDVTIENGSFRIMIEFLRGHTDYTFRFKNAHFELAGYDSNGTTDMAGSYEYLSINYLTGKVKRETGNISDDHGKVTWTMLKKKAPLTMDQIGDGTDFDPGVE